MPIHHMSIGTPQEIAAVEARIQELESLWKQNLPSNVWDQYDLLIQSKLDAPHPGFPEGAALKAQLLKSIAVDQEELKARLEILKKPSLREAGSALAKIALIAGCVFGAGAALDRAMNTEGMKLVTGALAAALVGAGLVEGAKSIHLPAKKKQGAGR